MSHLSRLVTENVSQVLALGVGLFDRAILTAVLFRYWGPQTFEAWSVCLAAVGLISLFEFGANLYFNNRLMTDMEQGRVEDARHTLFVANTMFFGFAAVSALFMAAFMTLNPPQHAAGATMVLSIALLSISSAARLAVLGNYSLYRANRQFARLVTVMALGDVAYVLAVLATVLGGGGLLAASVAAAAVGVVQTLFVVGDTRRRFAPHALGFALPRRDEFAEIVAISGGYFAQAVPLILLSSIPVIALGHLCSPG